MIITVMVLAFVAYFQFSDFEVIYNYQINTNIDNRQFCMTL